MTTMGKHALLLSLLLATPLANAQTGPITDLPMGHPYPPDTSIAHIQADLGRDAMITPLKISYGKKSAEWTAPELAPLPHETIQTTNQRT